MDFLNVVEVIQPQSHVLVNGRQRERDVDSLHEDGVGVFHSRIGLGKQVSELHAHVRIAGLAICWNHVLTFEDFHHQLVVLLFYRRRDHHILLFRYSRHWLCLKFHRAVFFPKHGHADFNIANDLAKGHFNIGQGQPAVLNAVVVTAVNRAYRKLIAPYQGLKQFLLSVMN